VVTYKPVILTLVMMVATTAILLVAEDPDHYSSLEFIGSIIVFLNDILTTLGINIFLIATKYANLVTLLFIFIGLAAIIKLVYDIYSKKLIISNLLDIIIEISPELYAELKESAENNLDGLKNIGNVLIFIIDSVLIPLIYIILLSLLGGSIVYLAHFEYGLSIYLSVLIFINLLIIEAALMLYNNSSGTHLTKDKKILKHSRSIPSLGIILSFPVVFGYKLVLLRDPIMFSRYELYILFAYIRYLVLNPIWLSDNDKKSNPFRGMRGIDPRKDDSSSFVKKSYITDMVAKCAIVK
jgi:hypothetical protein